MNEHTTRPAPAPVPLSNSFGELTDPLDDPDDDLLNFMNAFAHRVQIGKKQSQKSRKPREDIDSVIKEFGGKPKSVKRKEVVIKTVADLERIDVQKIIRPLPIDPVEISRLATLCPSQDDVPLKPGQMWVLFDTGASCSAMKVSRDCPDYAEHVTATRNSKSGQGAETAGGGSITERGEVTVDLLIEGMHFQLPVRDMDVSMPISSGRTCVKNGNYAIIHEHGGTIKNMATGKEIQLHARQGVYFFKAKMLPPGSVKMDTELPFARQG